MPCSRRSRVWTPRIAPRRCSISGVDLLAAEGEGSGWIASTDELRER